jgi:superfamily II RNA helicase
MGWSRDRKGEGRPEPRPPDVVRRLRADGLLPGIYFFFSRRDCERAAESCATLDLGAADAAAIAAFVDERLGALPAEDRSLGQVVALRRLLPLGVGFHHAGLLPVLKVLVEELFNRGLLQVVFATDTLSLGINMPAKTVVVGELTKFDGESRRPLTPNEYQQLTGRAGRRGLDERGVAVVPYSPWVEVEEVLAIGTGDLLPIESTFTLRYNTVLNLWDAGPNPTERLAHLFASSLREYQLDDDMKALQDELGAIRIELNTLSKEQLAEPARGKEARKLRGRRYANRYTRRDLLQDRFAELEQELLRARQAKRNRARRTLRSLERVLDQFAYLRDGRPTEKAAGLRELFDGNGLILTEALARGVFRQAEPAEIMEVLSWFCYDRDKSFYNRFRIPPRVWEMLQRLERVQDAVLRAESDAGLALTPGFATLFSGIAYAWCQGIEFGELLSGIELPEGDVMLTFNKTLDLGRQLRDAVAAVDPTSELIDTLAAGERLMRRGIVALCCNVGVPTAELDGRGTAEDAELVDVDPSGRLSVP